MSTRETRVTLDPTVGVHLRRHSDRRTDRSGRKPLLLTFLFPLRRPSEYTLLDGPEWDGTTSTPPPPRPNNPYERPRRRDGTGSRPPVPRDYRTLLILPRKFVGPRGNARFFHSQDSRPEYRELPSPEVNRRTSPNLTPHSGTKTSTPETSRQLRYRRKDHKNGNIKRKHLLEVKSGVRERDNRSQPHRSQNKISIHTPIRLSPVKMSPYYH